MIDSSKKRKRQTKAQLEKRISELEFLLDVKERELQRLRWYTGLNFSRADDHRIAPGPFGGWWYEYGDPDA